MKKSATISVCELIVGDTGMIETLKSVLQPQGKITEIRNVMTKTQYIVWFVGLLLYSMLVFGLYGYMGIGSENLSAYMETLKETRWEMAKFIFFIGKVVAGFLYPFLFTLFFTVLFWITFEEMSFWRIWKLQLIPFIVMLVAKSIELIFFLILRVPEQSSPLGLGVITQLITPQIFWVELASNITIFVLFAAYLQYVIFHKSLHFTKRRVIIAVSASWIFYILIEGTTDTLFRVMKVMI